jgi:trimethylamine--corrinoid protein Co-methyltransferase
MLSSENCQSFEKLVIDNDICGMALRLGRGIKVDPETLAEELITEKAPGGNYLSTRHTLDWFRTETFFPSTVIDRQSAKKWQADGSKDARQRAKETAASIMEGHEPVQLDSDSARMLRETMLSASKKRGIDGSSIPF